MSNPTTFLDLDAVTPPVEVTLKLNGKTHTMEEPSLEDFLKTMKELEELSLNATPTQEVELSMRMILRSFPTITELDLVKLKPSQLKAISDFAMKAGGQQVEKASEEGASENPPTTEG